MRTFVDLVGIFISVWRTFHVGMKEFTPVVVVRTLILNSYCVDFTKVVDIIKRVWLVFIDGKIFFRILCKYFLHNKFCSFLIILYYIYIYIYLHIIYILVYLCTHMHLVSVY